MSRIADTRTSTPGRGERQWTNVPNDSRFFNTGAQWQHGGDVNRVPIPREPDILSDVEHRSMGRTNLAQNARMFGTSADAEYEQQVAKEQAKRDRKRQQEERLLQMVSSKHEYQQTVRAETLQAHAQQAAEQSAAQLDDDRRTWAMTQQGLEVEQTHNMQLQAQKLARRELAQQVAQEQLQQMQLRKNMSLVEREAEKQRVKEEYAQGMHWEARFGRSLR